MVLPFGNFSGWSEKCGRIFTVFPKENSLQNINNHTHSVSVSRAAVCSFPDQTRGYSIPALANLELLFELVSTIWIGLKSRAKVKKAGELPLAVRPAFSFVAVLQRAGRPREAGHGPKKELPKLMRNNFRNPRFKPSQDAVANFQPLLRIEIEIDAAGQTRVNRPAAWSNLQFALFLNTLTQKTLEEAVKERSMIIGTSKETELPATAGAEASGDASETN